MRKRIALSAVTIGVLVACGPHDVDLGGGSGGQGAGGNDGVGGSFDTGGVGGSYTTGGAYATGGSGGAAEPNCSNGVVEYPEVCDDGGEPGGCPDDCGLQRSTGGAGGTGGSSAGGTGGTAEQYCGDGVVQFPEVCDDPGDPRCPSDCGIGSGVGGTGAYGGSAGMAAVGGGPAGGVCGDGIVDLGEWCDDGNTVGGDGCSEDCRSEAGGAGGGGGVGGSISTGGGPATGGYAGYATGGTGGAAPCVTEVVISADGCADNDVLLGQGYERCQALRRSLTSVRFSAPCDDYTSYAVEIDCCERAGVAGGGGGTGLAGAGGVGGSG